MINKNQIISFIETNRDKYIETASKVWEYAETRFEEYQSAELLCKVLEEEGFSVEKGVADMETSFVATWGKGNPVIGILGEFDALSGLSQKGGVAYKEQVEEGGNGHGCGHHMLGVAGIAAITAVKEYLTDNNIEATIKYFGCPGEEGGSGKAYMARAGLFNDLDVALTWHPSTLTSVWTTSSLANYQVYYKFYGVSSHAGGSPHLGRSALDAVELMNVGVNYMREHVIPEARIHYAVLNSGGRSPNVVQSEAVVLYMIRAPKTQTVQEMYEWVNDIAKGAALMTQTRCEIVFDKACSNLIPNRALEGVFQEKLEELGPITYDATDIEYAEAIRESLNEQQKRQDWSKYGNKAKELAAALEGKALADIVLPYLPIDKAMSGSTDVGDASWVVPTAQFGTTCYALGTPGHSWQNVAQGTTSLAYKGMLHAAKVLALSTLELIEKPETIERAKQEHKERLDGETYNCAIPADVKPAAVR